MRVILPIGLLYILTILNIFTLLIGIQHLWMGAVIWGFIGVAGCVVALVDRLRRL